MEISGLKAGAKFYFIGIGGISMSALALCLKQNGFYVEGSDLSENEQVYKLREFGVNVWVGEVLGSHGVEDSDAVVYTDAIPLKNKELSLAYALGKRVFSRASLLKEISVNFSKVIAVGGSHGKTTCTAMCGHVLKASAAEFCMHVGGEDSQLGNYYFSGKEYLVTEACEYKKNLLMLPAHVAVLLNVDKDHLECYDGEEDLKNTFLAFCRQAQVAVVCLDDPVAYSVNNAVTFSLYEKNADYRASYLRQDRERYSFSVYEYGVRVCRIRLKAVGRCNVYNALAAFAVMRTLGYSVDEIKKGLESFISVKRRFEEIGKYRGAELICDYAHHPREILSTVQTAVRIAKNRLYVIFQPHTYSRTASLMPEFVEALKQVDRLLIYKTYPARERYDENGDGKTLAKKVACLYADNPSALRAWLDCTLSEGDTVLFLGAGDIYYLAKCLTQKIDGLRRSLKT